MSYFVEIKSKLKNFTYFGGKAIGLAIFEVKWAKSLWPTVISTPGVESKNDAASWAHEE